MLSCIHCSVWAAILYNIILLSYKELNLHIVCWTQFNWILALTTLLWSSADWIGLMDILGLAGLCNSWKFYFDSLLRAKWWNAGGLGDHLMLVQRVAVGICDHEDSIWCWVVGVMEDVVRHTLAWFFAGLCNFLNNLFDSVNSYCF